ncbi:MAG: aromatic amino acid transport family protein [Parachlamydiales bacterium]|jgi:tyrosine-specific transport protein
MQQNTIPDTDNYHGGSLLSGILIVSGTCIGAGMLALPVITGMAGFLPAIVISTLCWLFMLCTGMLFLEATLWLEDGANVMTLTGHFLGKLGKIAGGASFIFLYYCLLISYFSAGSGLCRSLINNFTGITVPGGELIAIFTIIFGLIVWLGPRMIDRVNGVLMIGLVVSYLLIVFIGADVIQAELLQRMEWNYMWLAAPTLFSAYGFHNVIPSLATYLKRNVSNLKWTVIIGTTIPYIVYNIWQLLIIGSLNEVELEAAAISGMPITDTLQAITSTPWMSTAGTYFGLFALVTSLLGVGLSMIDFMGDALKVRRDGLMRLALCVISFTPPAFLAWIYPGIFLKAIGVAGGFGEAILNGMIPILMVWIGRYQMRLTSACRLWGGKPLLVVLMLFTLLIICIECFDLFFYH